MWCKSISAVLLFTTILNSSVALAKQSSADRPAEIGLRLSYQECINASGGVNPAMRDCMSVEFAFQDERLNAVYKKLMGTFVAEEKQLLRNEERSWIRHKDAACSAGDEPGQTDEVTAYDCVVIETARRAQELEHRIGK